VYPGQGNRSDTGEIVLESSAHLQEGLHPLGAGDSEVKDAVGVDLGELGVGG